MIDHLNTLNDLTPKVRCKGRDGVDPNLLFGLDTKLFRNPLPELALDGSHHDEVQTVTVYKGGEVPFHSHHSHHDPSRVHTHPNGTTTDNSTKADNQTEREAECIDLT